MPTPTRPAPDTSPHTSADTSADTPVDTSPGTSSERSPLEASSVEVPTDLPEADLTEADLTEADLTEDLGDDLAEEFDSDDPSTDPPSFSARPTSPGAVLWEKRVLIRGEEVTIRAFDPKTPRTAASVAPSADLPTLSDDQPSQPVSEPSAPKTQVSPVLSSGVAPLPPAGNLQMLIRRNGDHLQAVLMEGPVVVEHHVERSNDQSIVGNIYLGVVKAVVPALEAAFVDIGTPDQAILRPRGGIANVKVDDRVLVRAVKDAYDNKGPKLKSELSLTGRYLVLLADTPGKVAVSRHLPQAERDKLRSRLAQLLPDGMGLIARSAAANASTEDLQRDLADLLATWSEISAVDISAGPAPRVVYSEPALPVRMVREYFSDEYKRLITNDPVIADELKTYLDSTAGHLSDRVEVHSESGDLFERFHVLSQLRKALDRKVFLASGGHIVIDKTEALTAIDVNTGKFTGAATHAETVFLNNLEAAEEVARQIRLRDIGGLIVIDFVDMVDPSHRAQVLERFQSALGRDRTTSDVFTISALGLVEMSRKRRSSTLLDSFSHVCSHCSGSGRELHLDDALLGPASPIEANPAHRSRAARPAGRPTQDPTSPAAKPHDRPGSRRRRRTRGTSR